jgi:ribosomal protein S27AE
MKNIEILESKLSEVEIDSIVRKRRLCQNCNGQMKKRGEDHHENVSRSRQRRNGSIQNIRKT